MGAGTAVTTTFDEANRPTSDSAGGSYTSDLDGRLTARPGQTLEWDALGRLERVKNSGGTVLVEYTYDPLDRLLVADYGATRTRLRYASQTTAIAQLVDDSIGTAFRHIGNDLTAIHLLDWTGSGSNQRFYGTNGHHEVTWTADSTGDLAAYLRYHCLWRPSCVTVSSV